MRHGYFHVKDQAGFMACIVNPFCDKIRLEKFIAYGDGVPRYYLTKLRVRSPEGHWHGREHTNQFVAIYRDPESRDADISRFWKHIKRRPKDQFGDIEDFCFTPLEIQIHALFTLQLKIVRERKRND